MSQHVDSQHSLERVERNKSAGGRSRLLVEINWNSDSRGQKPKESVPYTEIFGLQKEGFITEIG